MPRLTRKQMQTSLMTFGATPAQAEAFTGKARTRTKKPVAREQIVVNAVMQYLKLLPDTFAFRVNTQGVPLHDGSGGFRPAPTTGVSDIVGCHQGRFLAIECKAERGVLSQGQREFLRQVELAGGIALVARSVQDVIDGLEGA